MFIVSFIQQRNHIEQRIRINFYICIRTYEETSASINSPLDEHLHQAILTLHALRSIFSPDIVRPKSNLFVEISFTLNWKVKNRLFKKIWTKRAIKTHWR
jgi:hypothetical protein